MKFVGFLGLFSCLMGLPSYGQSCPLHNPDSAVPSSFEFAALPEETPASEGPDEFNATYKAAPFKNYLVGNLVEFITEENKEAVTKEILAEYDFVLQYAEGHGKPEIEGKYYYEVLNGRKVLRRVESSNVLAPVWVTIFGGVLLYKARFSIKAEIISCDDKSGIEILDPKKDLMVIDNPEDNEHLSYFQFKSLNFAFTSLFSQVAQGAILKMIEETDLFDFCE